MYSKEKGCIFLKCCYLFSSHTIHSSHSYGLCSPSVLNTSGSYSSSFPSYTGFFKPLLMFGLAVDLFIYSHQLPEEASLMATELGTDLWV